MTQLTKELELLSTSALHDLVIVLPTKRLCAWMVGALSQSRGSCLLPRLLTWEDFIREEAGTNPELATVPRALWESLLLAQLTKMHALRPGDEHEIAQLFTDIRRACLPANPFIALMEKVASWGIDEDDLVQTRIAELAELWQMWNAAPFIDAEQGLTAMVEGARTRLTSPRPSPWSKLYLVGMTSVQKRDIALLTACLQDPRTEVWLPETKEEDPKAPLAELVHIAESFGRVLRMPEDQRPLPLVTGAPVSSPLAEVLSAMQGVKEALAAGTPPHQIGIAVTDEKLYGPLIREAVKSLPCSVNLAISIPLARTRIGSWLQAMIAACKEPDDLQTKQSFLLHPISRRGLNQSGPHVWSYQKLARVFGRGSEEPFSAVWDEQRLSFAVDEDASLLQWWQRFARLCQIFRPGMARLKGQLDRAAGETFFDFLTAQIEGLATTASAWSVVDTEKLSGQTFLSLLESQFANLGVRTTGDPFHGLQVLGIEELRFLPMQKVIILGATEGLFPRSRPQDRLLDGRLKNEMSLPGWEAVEAIENTTFTLLAARLNDLTLSYPEQIARRETVRSRFLEKLIGEKRAQFTEERPLLEIIAKSLPPLAEVVQMPVAFDPGLLDEPHSTRAIEDLIACPARFALRKWRVRESALLQLNDLKDEGEWLHAVLEVFFTGTHKDLRVVDELALPSHEEEFLLYCEERLHVITSALLPTAAHGASLHLQLQEASWPAFARHLWQLWQDQIPHASDARFLKEYAPEECDSLWIDVGEERVKLRMRIDSVDPFGDDGIVVTDYKRRYTTPKGDVLSGISPQLPLYAAALAARGYDLEHMLLGYFSVLRGEWVGIAAGDKASATAKDRGLLSARGEASLTASLTQIGKWIALRRAQTMETSRWSPDPSACSLCTYQGICRRDDPRYKGAMSEDLKNWRSHGAEEHT